MAGGGELSAFLGDSSICPVPTGKVDWATLKEEKSSPDKAAIMKRCANGMPAKVKEWGVIMFTIVMKALSLCLGVFH
jgi:hypothetical protein